MRDFELVHAAAVLYGQPWAIRPEKLEALIQAFERRRDGLPPLADFRQAAEDRHQVRRTRAAAIGAKLRDVAGMLVEQVGKVAVLPLWGTVVQRPGIFTKYSGGVSVEQFATAHQALLSDDGVKAIVWDVDSPGGSVAGVPEGGARLLQLRGRKRTVAVSNTVMASAAYWLAANANEVVAAPSSLTGSIGVVAAHQDWSKANDKAGVKVTYVTAGKFKAEGNYDEPLSAEGAEHLQQTVNDYYGQFLKAVARARNVSTTRVKEGFGEGRVMTADRAVAAGLADRVGTLDQVLQKLGAYDTVRGGPGGMAVGRDPTDALRLTRQALAEIQLQQDELARGGRR